MESTLVTLFSSKQMPLKLNKIAVYWQNEATNSLVCAVIVSTYFFTPSWLNCQILSLMDRCILGTTMLHPNMQASEFLWVWPFAGQSNYELPLWVLTQWNNIAYLWKYHGLPFTRIAFQRNNVTKVEKIQRSAACFISSNHTRTKGTVSWVTVIGRSKKILTPSLDV